MTDRRRHLAAARWAQTHPLARADEDTCPPGSVAVWTMWVLTASGVASAVSDDVHEVVEWLAKHGSRGVGTHVRRSIYPAGSPEHLAALATPMPSVSPPPEEAGEAVRGALRGLRAADSAIRVAERTVAAVAPPPPLRPGADAIEVTAWASEHVHRTHGDVVDLLCAYAPEVVLDAELMDEALPLLWAAFRTSPTPAEGWVRFARFIRDEQGGAEGDGESVTVWRASEATGAAVIAWRTDEARAHADAARHADRGGDGEVLRIDVAPANILADLGDEVIIDPAATGAVVEPHDYGKACLGEARAAGLL